MSLIIIKIIRTQMDLARIQHEYVKPIGNGLQQLPLGSRTQLGKQLLGFDNLTLLPQARAWILIMSSLLQM